MRKTAAHSLSKIYTLDNDQKPELVNVISKLLGDRTVMVLGSVVTVFTEVCPERLDLLHPHYRKLCQVLPDVDEWGQIMIINLLLRYARTQFLNPKGDGSTPTPKKKASGDSSDSEEGANAPGVRVVSCANFLRSFSCAFFLFASASGALRTFAACLVKLSRIVTRIQSQHRALTWMKTTSYSSGAACRC